jgi:replicative DNA helicase
LSEFTHVGQGDQIADAEVSVIAAIMLDNKLAAEIRAIVSPADFGNAQRGVLYRALLAMLDGGTPVDPTTVFEVLTQEQASDACASTFAVSTTANVLTHAAILRDRSSLRRLAMIAKNMIGMTEHKGTSEIVDYASRELHALVSPTGSSLQSQADALREFERVFELRRSGKLQDGIQTGLDGFDQKTGGLRPGETYVITASTGAGKTAMMLAMIVGVCRNEKAALVQSLEMSYQSLLTREYAAASGINTYKLQNPSVLTSEDEARMARGYSALIGAKIHYGASSTVEQIRRDCVALAQRSALDVLFVDYIGLISPSRAGPLDATALAEISRGLKLIAIDLKIPVVVLSQLNRNVADGEEPSLAGLKGSSAIEQDASVVLALWGETGATTVNWKLAKNRNGELARGLFDFERNTQRITGFRIVQQTPNERAKR